MEDLRNTNPEREIMPKDLFEHYVEARSKGYAGGGKSKPDPDLPGFKVFKYLNPNLPYIYEDRYTDTPKRPGNFGGFEINRRVSEEGSTLTLYTFGGGLTTEGERLGEDAVYSRLQKFLDENVKEVRFGNMVRFEFEDEMGKWVYEGDGEKNQWGWVDNERISHNGASLYELVGSGICFIPRF